MEITKNAVYDVIIVGGGVAGITAARHLLSSNVKKILILEAQDYLGGRIKTINTGIYHLMLHRWQPTAGQALITIHSSPGGQLT